MNYDEIVAAVTSFKTGNDARGIASLVTFNNVVTVIRESNSSVPFPTFQRVNNIETLSNSYYTLLEDIQTEINGNDIPGILALFTIENILKASVGQELEVVASNVITHNKEVENVVYATKAEEIAAGRSGALASATTRQAQNLITE